MNDKIIIKNYLNSLEQKYNAVCFDIDGTFVPFSELEKGALFRGLQNRITV